MVIIFSMNCEEAPLLRMTELEREGDLWQRVWISHEGRGKVTCQGRVNL